MGLGTILVQILKDSLQIGKGTHYEGRTASSRSRGSGVGWMEGKLYGGLCGGIEEQAKLLGGWSSVDK